MAIRQRAVLAEDKRERRQAILDAAERLLARSPERVANMAEVADEAGLAKGTVYLYFPSKEELLLTLHERNIDDFFHALQRLLDRPQPITIDEVLGLVRSHLVDEPTFLPLATRCFGIMATGVPQGVANAFKERMSVRLSAAGSGLERHFIELPAGRGVALLRHSYALMLGLWQVSSSGADAAAITAEHCPMHAFDYAEQLAQALRALWRGTVGRAVVAAVPSSLEV